MLTQLHKLKTNSSAVNDNERHHGVYGNRCQYAELIPQRRKEARLLLA